METDRTLDVKGLTAGRVGEVASGTLEGMRPGQVLRVITGDYKAGDILTLLCRRMSCQLVDTHEDKGVYSYTIRR